MPGQAVQQAVSVFLCAQGELILESFTKIKSVGKDDHPQLATCRRHKTVLLIAKLDRPARNVHFISGLMESGVEFIPRDMPEANRLTIQILAAMTEHERGMISRALKSPCTPPRRAVRSWAVPTR